MDIPQKALLKNHTPPPPYEEVFNISDADIETAQQKINNCIELLINTFISFGIDDTDEIINNIRNNPENYINNKKPIIKNLALSIIDFNNIKNNFDNERTTTSLTTLKNYIDNQIKNVYDNISSIQNNYNEIITQQNNKIQNRLNIVEYVELFTFLPRYSTTSCNPHQFIIFKYILLGNINYSITLLELYFKNDLYNHIDILPFTSQYETFKTGISNSVIILEVSFSHLKLGINNWIHTFIDSPEYNDGIKIMKKYKCDYGKDTSHKQKHNLFIHKLYVWLNTDIAKTFIDNGDIIIDDDFDYISKYKNFEI